MKNNDKKEEETLTIEIGENDSKLIERLKEIVEKEGNKKTVQFN